MLDSDLEERGPADPSPGPSPDGLPWFALYVRSRRERVVEAGLRRRGFDTYLPLLARVRKWSDRKKVVEFPCFPGYVFLRCAEPDRERAFTVPGAVRYLGSGGAAVPIPSPEIERVREALSRRVPFEPYPCLEPGSPVTIERGPLRGLTGVLLRRQKGYRLVVAVRAMGRGISAEVDAIDVEPS
jgi:transcription antitermination factor NusG